MAKQQRSTKQAKFVLWMGPLLDALRELGGSGTPPQVEEIIARTQQVSDEQRQELMKGGGKRFSNQVAFARQYLIWEGLIKSPKRGVWSLTEKGDQTHLSGADARAIFSRWVKHHAELRKQKASDDGQAASSRSAEDSGTTPATPAEPEYDLATCSQDTGLALEILARWVKAIERKKQAVLYGPPGTGKTFVAERLAKHLSARGGFLEVVQFHPAYSYEDFVQGIRPAARADGGLEYRVLPGRFIEFCRRAEQHTGACVLIVDEINRANLSRVFGELMYLLEYRDRQIPLAAGGMFQIPSNVRILGTMNTADRSIALVDHALRRRFAFLELRPDYEILRQYHEATGFNVAPLIELLQQVNRQIDDRHYEVGISFFLRNDLRDQLEDIWRMEIEPYLEEVFFDQDGKLNALRWDQVRGGLGT